MNKGQQFEISIAEIQAITGLERRSVIDALRSLPEIGLIERSKGSRNRITILLPNNQEDGRSEFPPEMESANRLGTAGSPKPAVGAGTVAPSDREPVSQVGHPPAADTPKPVCVPALIASCYRPLTNDEYSLLLDLYEGENRLHEHLETAKLRFFGVAPEMSFDFFVNSLDWAGSM